MKDDYQSRMEAASLTVQHADLIGKFYKWERDLMLGMLAALKEAARHAPDMAYLYEDTPEQISMKSGERSKL